MRDPLILSAWLLIAALPLPASAQPSTPATRAEALRQQRERKQQQLRPNQRDRLQRILDLVEDPPLFLVAPEGFHPKLGTLTSGSSFAIGVGHRNRTLLNRYGILEAWTAVSLRRYWAVEGRARLPDLAGGRVMAEGVASVREYPRESFFGLGPDSRRADRTSFLLRTSQVSGRAGVRLGPVVMIGGGLGLVTPRTGPGKRRDFPSIADRFDATSVPGLGVDVNFLVSSGFLEMDYREPKNARRGGWYRVDLSQFRDRNGGAWSFDQTDIDLRQFIGFFADRRVIALRAFMSSSNALAGSAGVPFYMMPTLGGNDTLRGFRTYRFRGPHALLLQAEYRWELWSGLDAALFHDAGKVALERSDLGLNGLEHNYGFGFRFNTANGVILRVDTAFGSRDGKHLHIVFGGVF